jgi:transcriptional regulator with XRE-family HTH domain
MARLRRPDFEIVTQILSTNLKALRAQAELTQAELAAKAGVSRSLVQKIELAVQTGSEQAQEQIAKALNVETVALLNSQPLASATSAIAAGFGTGTGAEKLASRADLKNFNLWLVGHNPTRQDLAQLKKLVQSYFCEK